MELWDDDPDELGAHLPSPRGWRPRRARHIQTARFRFEGYQQASTYRYKADADDPGEPVSRIRVRALMTPPGVPDFFTRRRLVDAGRVRLEGRAWSGTAPIARVEVGVDGAWSDAELAPAVGEWASRRCPTELSMSSQFGD